MKLRLEGNHIRLRLTQTEVGRAAAGEEVTFATEPPGTPFQYSFAPTGDRVTAAFEGSRLRVTAPAEEVREWAASDQTGLYGEAGPVRIAIEKDFRCLVPRPGETDQFPHPGESDNERQGC